MKRKKEKDKLLIFQLLTSLKEIKLLRIKDVIVSKLKILLRKKIQLLVNKDLYHLRLPVRHKRLLANC